MKQYLIVVLISLLCCHCGNRTQEEGNDADIIMNLETFSDGGALLGTSVQYIPLETTDSCLLGDIHKIIHRKDRYFIVDAKENKVCIFSETGKHLFTLHKQGRGPGEYLDISDVDIDSQSNTYLRSSKDYKVIKYLSPRYAEYEEMPLDQVVTEFAFDVADRMWMANIFSEGQRTGLALYEDAEISTRLAPREGWDDLSNTFPYKSTCFSKSESELLFNQLYSPDVYRLTDGQMRKIVTLKTDRFVPQEYLLSLGVEDYYKFNGEYINGFQSIFSIDSVLYGQLWSLGTAGDFFRYDCTTGTGEIYNGIDPDMIAVKGIYTVVDSDLLGYAYATDIIYALNNPDIGREFRESLEPVAARLKEDDNPVLVKFRL